MGTFAWWPRLGCLGLGLAAGWLAARAPLRCKAAGLAADAAAAAAACMAAQALLPTPARTAMLYAGLGALWGQGAARPCPRTGAAAACAWLVLYLPFTGALACLGGGALALAAGFPPMALLQFGPEGALGVLGAAALLGWRERPALRRMLRGREPDLFARWARWSAR